MSAAQKRRAPRRHISVRWKLFLTLFLFTLFLLLAVWVVQIRLLGVFYDHEKSSELQEVAEDIQNGIGEEELQQEVENALSGKLICARLFRVSGGAAEEIAGVSTIYGCFIHPMDGEMVMRIRAKTLENGGAYTKRVQFSGGLRDPNGDFRFPGLRTDLINLIYATDFTKDGTEYFLMLDTELTPISSTVNTLQTQFFWLCGAMLILTVLLTLFLSESIARPLNDITAKAGKLAKGDYTADFMGKGYREAEELAGALNFAAGEIGKTSQLQKELIANISHDLRTPLTMIRGYSEMMRDIPGENSPENIQLIIDETERLTVLVSDLLDLSKLQAGTMKPNRVELDLCETVRDAVGRYDQMLRHKGYRVEYRVPDVPVMIFVDRTMLLQVIYNLLNNAVNYTGQNKLVTVTLTVVGDFARVSVRDTGEGIPPEQIAQIWDRYYRADKLHKQATMGSGLGLSIVKEVLDKHAARYGVESALGVGSVFWFELPLSKPQEGEGLQ